MIHIDILTEKQQKLFQILKIEEWIKNFYLVGGTALALQLEHRQSIDFDFFSSNDFNNLELIEKVRSIGNYKIFTEDKNTLHGSINEIMLSFIGYKYPLLEKLSYIDNIKIAGIRDIACMKMSAIASRGSKKDFIDLYYILKQKELKEIFKDYFKKYKLNNRYLLLKSLVFFNDADKQPMPIMYNNLSWNEIKKELISKVKRFKL